MSKEVFEASPTGATGGVIPEGPYVTGAAPGVEGNVGPWMPRAIGAPNLAIAPRPTILPPPDPNIGDPTRIESPDEAIQAAQRMAMLQPPGSPQLAIPTPPNPKDFLLYIPLGPQHNAIVRIVGPPSEIESDHIDLLCENLLLQKRLLEKREAKKNG